ncbi:MAG: hypothetical protein GC192_02010 [Bacteroidetes bacterium]|nr:hypothetical protein [Bacteroidota bacterium]
MPSRTVKYYLDTFQLKAAAMLSFYAEKIGLLEGIKKQTRMGMAEWALFPTIEPIWQNTYMAYGFIEEPKVLARLLEFDGSGIPVGWKHAHPKAHNPLMVSYLALVWANHYYCTQDTNSKVEFMKLVDFLAEFGKTTDQGFLLPYFESVPKFGLISPWYSGIAQAVGSSVFIRAFKMTGNPLYREIAQKLCSTLLRPVEMGGFLEQLPEGGFWIREYPTFKISRVLNGFLFCLIALYEYKLSVASPPELDKVLDDCEATLFQELPNYIFGKYTRYAAGKAKFSNVEYQGLYVYLFQHLFLLSGKNSYLQLSKHFNRHTDWKAFSLFYESDKPFKSPDILYSFK